MVVGMPRVAGLTNNFKKKTPSSLRVRRQETSQDIVATRGAYAS